MANSTKQFFSTAPGSSDLIAPAWSWSPYFNFFFSSSKRAGGAMV